MRKFLALAFFLIFALAKTSWAADVTLHVTGTDYITSPDVVSEFTPAVMSGDEEIEQFQKGEVKFPALSGTNYTFATIQSALEFAENPQAFIESYYRGYYYHHQDSYDITYDSSLQAQPIASSIAVSIEISNIAAAVTLSDYSSLTDITFTATRTITAPGRHFVADNSSGTVTFSGITFNGSNSGGGVAVSDGTATFTRCTFTACDTSSNGGAVSISGGTVTMTAPTFSNCYASSRGGAVSVSGGTVNITGASFSTNEAADYGGALSITGGTVTVSGSSAFSGNTSYNGGAVSLTGGTLSLLYSSFTGNSATNFGGAVYSSSGLTVGTTVTFNTISDSSPNTAAYGGAVYIVSGTATFSGSQTQFTENVATESGGAVYIASGTLNLSGSGIAFTGNTVSEDSTSGGGAVYAGAGATVNITGENIAFTANEATAGDGGAFYLAGRSTVTISATSPDISANVAETGRGGAFFMAGGSTLNFASEINIHNNTANYGGGIYMANARNTTNFNITASEPTTFANNDALTSGGGIYAEANCNIITAPGISFTSNNARNGNGGAIWIADALQLPDGVVSFDRNTAGMPLPVTPSPIVDWPTAGNGGAIFAQTSSNAVIGTAKDYRFIGTNTARYHGGAVVNYSGDITIQGYNGSRSITVNNSAGLGGGLAASYAGSVTVNNCAIMNQSATNGSGGAIWAKEVYVNSADFGADGSPNQSTGSSNTGGGAIYVYKSGTASISNATFSYNEASQGGGAVYAEDATITIRNSYFHHNTAHNGNGGAVILRNNCTSSIISSTFRNNTSEYLDGGAIYAQGVISVSLSSFTANTAFMDGGAIYYDQMNGSNASFTMASSMLTDNGTLGGNSGGNGGAMYIAAVRATITACTFAKNHIDLSGNEGKGGGVYLNTSSNQTAPNRIENCTFYGNTLNDGSAPDDETQKMTSGGGGLSVNCEGLTRVLSCTFTENSSRYGGGAIYVEGGTVNLAGTLAVGNAGGVYDIWSDGSITSGGYNRIGVYGTGSGVTNFYAEARNDTDRTSYPSKGWNRSTFFQDNILSINVPPSMTSADSIPPFIGSSRTGDTEKLLTLMLNEQSTLPLEDRATNIIPYSRRTSFPNTDERGVSRVSDSAEINLDIGACFYDFTRITITSPDESPYTISRVEISGIPNNLRRVGQTASLVARVYYTNGRTALGGTGTGEEPVTWTSDKPNIIRIDENTGDITVLSFTPGNTYVTITVTTVRGNLSGEQLSDSKPIRVTEYTASYLNTSTELANYLQGYAEDMTEYDILLQLSNASSSAVTSSAFQAAFSSIWAGVTPSQVSASQLSAQSLTLGKTTSYTASDGYELTSGKAGVEVNVTGRNAGDLLPLTFTWKFTSSDLRAKLGYDMTGRTLDGALGDAIFDTLRIDFRGVSSSWPVIGGVGVKASEAMQSGVLSLTKTADGGLSAQLTAYLANVTAASVSGLASSSGNDGPQIVDNILIVPDGNGSDGKISGSMIMADRLGTSQQTNTESEQTQTNTETGTEKGTQPTSGGGGGCNAFSLVPIIAALIFRRKR